MKTVAKINPEEEYENAIKLIELSRYQPLDAFNANSLENSVENLITAARILIEREDRRRGKKMAPKKSSPKGRKKGEQRKDVKKLPSERYPNLEVEEDVLYPSQAPRCPCCQNVMKESGLFDVTEKLEVIPKRYYIQRFKRPKFNCGKCHGAMVNTPALPSIVPVSNYGDSLIIDVTLSKFCDLIPIERFAQMAFRDGVEGLPPQSLIELTHHLAEFLTRIYLKIKKEVLSTKVLLADETTHNMLEGDETSKWYLWGFFSKTASYFEAHGTRSGDVVFDFLKESMAEFLITDGYTGYNKALKKIKKEFDRNIIPADCNAHAVRYFKDARGTWEEECEPFLELYGEIYKLEEERKLGEEKLSTDEQIKYRQQMIPLFEQLKEKCEKASPDAMVESGLKKALGYFLNHYEGLTLCTSNLSIPLDNNHSEREVRSPVVGRKTWYGTHSKRGASTTAIHFSIIQSCKVNNINPRNYYPWVVEQILERREVLTPFEYSKLKGTQ